jgi:hypothetical protein
LRQACLPPATARCACLYEFMFERADENCKKALEGLTVSLGASQR